MGELSTYQAKRDFEATPEPAGSVEPGAGPLRFVIQEHHATALHWDLRLEHDGVLASWALPKGVPPDPRVNHLAVHTEDHPMQYLTFHGEIPAGNYGAGSMTVWDEGTYDLVKWTDRDVIVVFHGARVEGRHALFQTRGKQWMIHRMDPPVDADREVWPGWPEFPPHPVVEAGGLPAPLADHGMELAWGGARLLAYLSGGRVQFEGPGKRGPGALGLGGLFPDLRGPGEAMGLTELVIDGCVVVLGDDGRPSAARLAERLGTRSDAVVRRLSARYPATLMVSDLLWLDGHRTTALGYEERRQRLDDLALASRAGPGWQVPRWYPGPDGPALLAAAGQQGLAGVVAKPLAPPYGEGVWTFVAACGKEEA